MNEGRLTYIFSLGSPAKLHDPHPPSLSWKKASDFAYVFNNAVFHITSDEEWASLSRVETLDIQDNHQDHPTIEELYIVSMQQQLHCLNLVRVAHLSYHQSKPKLDPSFYHEADLCIEQLRQHIMCNSDITLDPTEYFVHTNGEIEPQTNGTVALHRCRNWKELESAIHRRNSMR